MRRLFAQSAVKWRGSTVQLPLKLASLSGFEAGGMRGVAVKCIDIAQNANSVGSLPGPN